MAGHSIDRIRNAKFSHAVRGYDRAEVDQFLSELADWVERGGEAEAGSEGVRAELEQVGEQVAGILTEAHDAAQAIRGETSAEVRQSLVQANVTAEALRTQAQEYADEAREEADAYARKTRAGADVYATQTREEAEAEAREVRESARAEAEEMVGEANSRRRDVESVIGDLSERRDAVLAELDRLASGITGTATEHRGGRFDPGAERAEGAAEDESEDRPDAGESLQASRRDDPA